MSKTVSWIDASRLIAIFGVILIHISGPVFTDSRSSFFDTYVIANAFDSLARASVPVFAMLSGALLLGKEIALKSIQMRILRVGIPLVFWSLVYAYLNSYWSKTPFDFFNSITSMTNAPSMYHLWFVYMIIGFYLLLPILRTLSERIMSNRPFALYFFSLWFIVNSITIYFPHPIFQRMYLSGFLSWSGYFILGYYLVHAEWTSAISKKISALVFFLASASTFALSWYLNITSPVLIETAYEYLSPNVIIASCAALLWLKQIKIPPAWEKSLSYLSSMTFSVYFMHLLVISILTSGIFGFSFDHLYIHSSIGILGLTIATFLFSFLIAAFIKNIPYSAKLLG